MTQGTWGSPDPVSWSLALHSLSLSWFLPHITAPSSSSSRPLLLLLCCQHNLSYPSLSGLLRLPPQALRQPNLSSAGGCLWGKLLVMLLLQLGQLGQSGPSVCDNVRASDLAPDSQEDIEALCSSYVLWVTFHIPGLHDLPDVLVVVDYLDCTVVTAVRGREAAAFSPQVVDFPLPLLPVNVVVLPPVVAIVAVVVVPLLSLLILSFYLSSVFYGVIWTLKCDLLQSLASGQWDKLSKITTKIIMCIRRKKQSLCVCADSNYTIEQQSEYNSLFTDGFPYFTACQTLLYFDKSDQ